MNIKILALDGGGSKGIYTIGILKELENNCNGKPLHSLFDFIYGTSTGAIIAALISTGIPMKKIEEIYLDIIPEIMSKKRAQDKTSTLIEKGNELLEDITFDNLLCDVGIVALNLETKEPLIFKSNVNQAHGSKGSFLPGFGCELLTAVVASASAYPVFEPVTVKTKNKGDIKTVDGGFIANNPSFYAAIDMVRNGVKENNIKILNLGTGTFGESPMSWKQKVLNKFSIVNFFTTIFNSSTNTNARLLSLIYPAVKVERINGTFLDIKTNFVEKKIKILNEMLKKGQYSYMQNEQRIKKLLELK